jgi:hypothetical protein
MQQITDRIVEAQSAINAEIKNLASSLGFKTPRLAGEYVPTMYEQIASHLETTAKALASINQDYAESQEPEESEEESDDTADQTATTTTSRRSRTTKASADQPLTQTEG